MAIKTELNYSEYHDKIIGLEDLGEAKSEPYLESSQNFESTLPSELKAEYNLISEFNPKSGPEPEPTTETLFKVEQESQLNLESKLEPDIFSESDPTSQSLSKASGITEQDLVMESEKHLNLKMSSELTESAPKTFTKNVQQLSKLNLYTPRHDFHRMDCTDIVIGSARGLASRVGDYYTRDRSTPQHDEFYGGKSDLTFGTGFEENGVTTIIFRKKLDSNDLSDHSLVNDLIHVIWAKGQELTRYEHKPPSGLEKEISSVPNFYQPDELKYHGHNLQRGVTQINFFEKQPKRQEDTGNENIINNDCLGQWKHPQKCSIEKHNCDYFARWETIGKGDEMRWYIETTSTYTWTGIGFSNDDKMSQTDAIIGWVDSKTGRPFLMDTWINGYSAPRLDDSQDIYNASGRIEKGVTILEFTRKRISGDEKDFSFTEDHCLYLIFPVVGGAFNAVNKKIKKHEQIPIITPSKVCLKSCGKQLESLLIKDKPQKPYHLVYSTGIKLMNLADNFEAPIKGTKEYDVLANTISNSFETVLGPIPGFNEINIVDFEKDGLNRIIAKFNIVLDKEVYENIVKSKLEPVLNNVDEIVSEKIDIDGLFVKRILKNSIETGKVGSLTVDPQYLHFETLEYTSTQNYGLLSSFFQISEVRLCTVLGCIGGLVLIAIIQAVCTMYKTSKKYRNQKEHLIPNSAWKDYSSNTNYAFTETEEKNDFNYTNKPLKSSKIRDSQSQLTTLPMSLSPTSKSQQPHYPRNGCSKELQHHISRYDTSIQSLTDNNNRNPSGSDVDAYHNQYSRSSYTDRAHSLPRPLAQENQDILSSVHQQGYYTQDRKNRNSNQRINENRDSREHSNERRYYHDRSYSKTSSNGTDTPDFYFMPSQRKYSGEVVRVYVDYNKDPKH